MNKRQILEYLLTNRTQKVCGRIDRSQLDFTNADFLLSIQAISNQTKISNTPFYILTIGAMILASCNQNPSKNHISIPQNSKIIQSNTAIVKSDNTNKVDENIDAPIDTIKSVEKTKSDPPKIPLEILTGEIDLYPDTIIRQTEPYHIVDTMPEFKGGVDSLISFVQQNLKYPERERENKIEGTVVVNFIVDKTGKIQDPKILRSVSKNFDREVIRVVNLMPDWIPGQQNGKKVDVLFNLPILFQL
ncbi:MAG: energy transducer TonB [Cryomorphaceae bacterium]|nr:energy transducer TonB [Cryomorphaceae bacterium]